MTISNLGLFGPQSVTWRLHADPVLAVGGLRALFLQALHPVAIAGVEAHSAFQADPWGRLTRTAEYIGVTTYGTTDEAGRAAARVRSVHRRFTATDPATGREWPVDDPELLLWVHCCEIDSFLRTAQRAGMWLPKRAADQYVGEQVRSARLVGLDAIEHGVPWDVASLEAYFDRLRPELHASAAAYRAARFLFAPPMPLWVRITTPATAGWASLASLAFSLLPAWARSMYSKLPAIPTTDIGATVALRALRATLLALPGSTREGPHYRAAKARIAATPVRRLEAIRGSAEPWGYHDVSPHAPQREDTGDDSGAELSGA
jgi:uncharacterized protein (DUF2236 family)